MGLFNPNYDKPGKGVSKNEPDKKGAALYWDLFSRKWRSYIVLNLLYALTCIPAFIFYFLFTIGLMPATSTAESTALSGMIAAFMVIFFAGSPFKSGFVYVLRNYVRQQHAWTTTDFFGKTKENLGQSVMAFIIDLVASCCFLVAIKFYFTASATTVWLSVLLGAVIIAMVLFAIMQSFTWCMMVTFDLKLSAIYKNAFLLSMATIPVNLLSLIIRIVATFAIFASSFISYLIILVIFLSAAGLLEQMLAYPAIKKFLMPKEDEPEVIEQKNMEEEND